MASWRGGTLASEDDDMHERTEIHARACQAADKTFYSPQESTCDGCYLGASESIGKYVGILRRRQRLCLLPFCACAAPLHGVSWFLSVFCKRQRACACNIDATPSGESPNCNHGMNLCTCFGDELCALLLGPLVLVCLRMVRIARKRAPHTG